MTNRACFVLPFATVAVLFGSEARADVAPPIDYVEQCTVAKQTTESTECVECGETRNPDAKGRCTKLLSGYCFTSACSPWGEARYNHTEVWCRTKDVGAPALPATISTQLSSYAVPVIDPTAATAGAPNCAGSKPIVANGGSSSVSSSDATGVVVPAASDDASSSTKDETAGDATGAKMVGGSGCSVSDHVGAARRSLAGLFGLLGLALLAKRRQAG